MVPVLGPQERPVWVRCAVRKWMRRQAAVAHVTVLTLMALAGLTACSMEAVSGPAFSSLNFCCAMATTALGAAAAACTWLAVCWVDRHGTWAPVP